ncbi:MAG: hypothetical protein Q7J10_09570 [Methanosarcinaceae archaeon]|nr:hypothetical protein [Methanosarcinaceae archaeon]
MQTKLLNKSGDYYYCSSCSAWHTLKPDTKGQQHLIYINDAKTNSDSAKYYFCTLCNKWHKGTHTAHHSHRAHIKSDGKVNMQKPPEKTIRTTREPVIGGFDGADGLWKSFDEHLNSISSTSLRERFKAIHDVGRSLEKEKVQCFSRKNGFSFIIRGLKVGQVILNPGGFNLTLMKNIHNTGKRSVRQEKNEYVFSNANLNPISNSDIKAHLLEQSKTLLALRSRNAIGYMEKWLHCLLIEQMESGGLPGLGLDFLYYETPVGKVKRNQQFGREHVDIVARERSSGALVVVEVKKDDSDIDAAIVQGISYVDWMRKHKSHLAPRVKQLGWDVNLDNVKLYVVAPGTRMPLVDGNARIVLVDRDWYVDEKVILI